MLGLLRDCVLWPSFKSCGGQEIDPLPVGQTLPGQGNGT